jgi:hypothetical protein
MSINPTLCQDQLNPNELFPLPIAGEVFILKRKDIDFQADVPGLIKKLKGER